MSISCNADHLSTFLKSATEFFGTGRPLLTLNQLQWPQNQVLKVLVFQCRQNCAFLCPLDSVLKSWYFNSVLYYVIVVNIYQKWDVGFQLPIVVHIWLRLALDKKGYFLLINPTFIYSKGKHSCFTIYANIHFILFGIWLALRLKKTLLQFLLLCISSQFFLQKEVRQHGFCCTVQQHRALGWFNLFGGMSEQVFSFRIFG